MSKEQIGLEKNKEQVLANQTEIAINQENGLAVVVIKPEAVSRTDEIISRFENSGLSVVKMLKKNLPENFVLGAMYKDLPEGLKEETVKHFNSGISTILLLKGGQDLLQSIITVAGDKTNPEECSEDSIRYLFGEHFGRETSDGKYYRNAVHRPENEIEQKNDLNEFKNLF